MLKKSASIVAASLFVASPAIEATTSLQLAAAAPALQAGAALLDPANGAANGCKGTASAAAETGASPLLVLPMGLDAVKTPAPPPPQALNCFWKICPDGDLRYSKPHSCTC